MCVCLSVCQSVCQLFSFCSSVHDCWCPSLYLFLLSRNLFFCLYCCACLSIRPSVYLSTSKRMSACPCIFSFTISKSVLLAMLLCIWPGHEIEKEIGVTSTIRIVLAIQEYFGLQSSFSFGHLNIFCRSSSPFWPAIWHLARCYLAPSCLCVCLCICR